ncbi:membrane protein [Candidatus Arthromitus sp. SFB-mouse-Japan]|uniref:mechanosensitive ion channel family protein n=1 Tax=Candidatus Arthromitus sp. SFB-mouse TaxID=49118 RepID=UPI00021B81EC|nr:mechanosensitive ion channel domain-containing protein [Candidatus Arthromitus sp. SFB-mouse]EIA23727.1 AefA protein [Candidatus Arthromitus sp. SFB-1]EIA23800.1 AefA protein [Candidatus Arthromitus sp. SFB-2]EIA25832.1 AefA protein [Candidatus Arthromitus sp. SFB-4]EIA26162.1 AefA protein [Candidatus Arthromitus sp. SFB-3]EIA28962.1 AefA protein [Candidatus Arthromitus sp. SFB-co]EIA29803.1 AefA protein [Candidatus Arthromitus sp. SFB-5]EIA29997.1 Putative Mechanosensitive ion channel [C
MKVFENLFKSLIDSSLKFGNKILDSVFSVIVIYIIYKIVCKVIKSVFSKKVFNSRIDKGHLHTIQTLVMSIARYSFITVLILVMIQNFVGAIGVTLTGIIGVALGFASQNILKDLFNGVFITFENQFTVGDYITINKGSNDFKGIVDSVQARVTKLRDFNGDYHVIPNGAINQITNHSRKDSRILIDIQVGLNQKSEDVVESINYVLNKYSHDDITVKPYIYGTVSLDQVSITYRIIGYSKPLTHWGIENELRQLIMDRLLIQNIILPTQRYSIIRN